MQTRTAADGMEASESLAAPMVTLRDAHMKKLPHRRSFPRAKAPLDVVHMDVVTLRRLDLPAGVDGARLGMKYGVVFVDDYSRLKRVYFCKGKDEVPALVRLFLLEMGSHAMYGSHFVMRDGFRQLRVHTDGGKELNSAAMEALLLEFGLSANVTSSPHTPASNGVAERAIQTLLRDTVAFLAMSGLPSRYWHWAMRHACAARNKLASQRTEVDGVARFASPHELFFGRRPDVTHMVAFGSPCRVLLLGPDRLHQGKAGLPSQRGHILGYGGDGVQVDGTLRLILGYVVLLRSGKVVYSRHVEIDERTLVEGGPHTPFASMSLASNVGSTSEADMSEDDFAAEEYDETDDDGGSPARALQPALEEDESERPATQRVLARDEMPLQHDPLRRDRASRSKTRAAQEHVRAATTATAAPPAVVEPRSYAEAMEQPEAALWKASMEEHLRGHEVLGSFVEVIVPIRRRAIPTKWVYTLKTNADGKIVRYKSRFVVKGFMQRPGIDYDQVFSPTIRSEQIRMMIGVGARQTGLRHPVHGGRRVTIMGKADVTNAYLTAPLPGSEEVLFELPEGYEPKLSAPDGHKVVARSVKAQQGLKQSGRVWNQHQHKCLLEQGFVQCEVAPCIYVKETDGGYVICGIFVDDLLFINVSDDSDALGKVVRTLSKHYEMKYDDKLEKFLGAEFEEREEGIYMHLNQYIGELMTKYEIADDETDLTPESTETGDKKADFDGEALLLRADKKTYQGITGALMFAMTTCRPDLAHAVNMLARRMSCPRAHDMKAARRVLRYLNGTRRLGLLFKFKMDSKAKEGLLAYADSDWANDSIERRSTSGFVVLLNGTPISWSSGLQSVVALSSCEAEYVALSECCRELAYLRQLMAFLREPLQGPVTTFEDNKGAIDLTNNVPRARATATAAR